MEDNRFISKKDEFSKWDNTTIRYIKKIIRKIAWSLSEDERDELLSRILLRLLIANFRREAKWTTFAYSVSRIVYFEFIREKEKKREIQFPEGFEPAVDENREIIEFADCVMQHLDERHRKVFELVFYEGLKKKDVAEIFGVTPPRVTQLIHEIVNTLRTYCADFNPGGQK